jgi:hypothetical protein
VIRMRSPYLRWVDNPAVARACVSVCFSLGGGAGFTAVACTNQHEGTAIKRFPARLPQESSP